MQSVEVQTRVRKTPSTVQITYRFTNLASDDPKCILDSFGLRKLGGNKVSWVSGCAELISTSSSTTPSGCALSEDNYSFAISKTCQSTSWVEVTIAWEYSSEIRLVRSDLQLGSSSSGSCTSCHTIVPETYNPTPIPDGSVQLNPICLTMTGFTKTVSRWELTNSNNFSAPVYVSKEGSTDRTAWEVPANSKIAFETTGDGVDTIYEVSILMGSKYIVLDRSAPPSNSCPVTASGCCSQLLIRNPNNFTIAVAYFVYGLKGEFQKQGYKVLYVCNETLETCTVVVPGVTVASSLIVSQLNLSGSLQNTSFSRQELQKDCSENCVPFTTSSSSTGTSGSSATTGSTGTTGVTTFVPTTSGTTVTTGSCPTRVCAHNQSTWDSTQCKCVGCPLTTKICKLQDPHSVFDDIICQCNATDSNSGGGGKKTNTAAVTGGTVAAGTMAGAAAAALYFLGKRKKKPEEEVVDADLAFANVIESNPLYQDPMPTYDNPIYEGDNEHENHGHH